jgi:hypothetical protein
VETRIPASERTSQKLNELLTHGVADGDTRTKLRKLAVRNIVEEALEAEVSEALGRGYYENSEEPGRGAVSQWLSAWAAGHCGRGDRVRRAASGASR